MFVIKTRLCLKFSARGKKNLIAALRSLPDLENGSLIDPITPIPEDGKERVSFDPFKERLQDYDEAWNWLGRLVTQYNWQYRKKICSKCPLTTQQKLKCHKVNNFKIIDGVKIQETHCSKLQKARANKLRNHVKHVFAMNPFLKRY